MQQQSITGLLKEAGFVSGGGSGKVTCVPGWRWNHPVPLEDFDIWYVVAGEGRMTLRGVDYPVRRGSCIIMRPGDKPDAEQNERDRLTVIFAHFHLTGGDGVWLLPPRHTQFEDRHEVEWILHRLLEADERTDGWQQTEFDGWLRMLFVQLFKRSEGSEPNELNAHQTGMMREAARLIQERGGHIAVREVAEAFGMSAPYLNRLFKRHAGLSVKAFLVRSKLERAKSLLTESSMTVTQVALALDYADVYIFSKLFRKYFGMSPSQYVRTTRTAGTAEGTGALSQAPESVGIVTDLVRFTTSD